MRELKTEKNQYVGINAHLHSLLLTQGRWVNFHNYHIGQLAAALRAQLLPIGYTAELEQSIQIRYDGELLSRPRSDVMIFDENPAGDTTRLHFSPVATANRPSIAALLALDERVIDHQQAIRIVPLQTTSFDARRPVVWLELLSPSNKLPYAGAVAYEDKRLEVLQGGLVFIELDYIHAQPTTFKGLPSYQPRPGQSKRQIGSAPYNITIIDPRPSIYTGRTQTHLFYVENRIPSLQIPLNGADRLDFDFALPYRKTFEEFLFGSEVNYAQLPPDFALYSPYDQHRIAARMVAVLEAAQAGQALDEPPLPRPHLPLNEALQRIEALTAQA